MIGGNKKKNLRDDLGLQCAWLVQAYLGSKKFYSKVKLGLEEKKANECFILVG